MHALIDERGADRDLMDVGLKRALKGDFKYWSFIVEHLEGKANVQPPAESSTATAAQADADALREALRMLREPSE